MFFGSRGADRSTEAHARPPAATKGENGMIVLTLSLLFLLSPLGAYIFLRFLKGPALLKTCTYRASGAIGGFVTVYGMLFGSYHKNASPGLTIMDKVSSKLRDAMIVLAVGEGYAL